MNALFTSRREASHGWLKEWSAKRRKDASWVGWIWLVPVLFLFLVFYAIPLSQMVYRSVTADGAWWANYAHLATEEIYLRVMWVTLQISVVVTIASIIIGYPAAYLLSRLDGLTLNVCLIFVLLPFWVSVLVRNYAWVVLLSRRGLINSFLISVGLVDQPLPLIFNVTGVVIGMTYVLVPFMILSLFAVMRNINPLLLRASASLGATSRYTFWRVVVPLSLPGVWAGSLLVFITAIGFFITPALLGGGRAPMIATLIESQIRGVLNFGIGSALGVTLLASVLVLYWLFDRLLGVEYMFRGRH